MDVTSLFGEGYQKWIEGIQEHLGAATCVFLIIAICLLGGFGISRICKLLKIPYVTGYIVLGILVGPSLLSFIPSQLINGSQDPEGVAYAGFSFLSDLTMGFIAFGCGRYFKWKNIKEGGKNAFVVSALTAVTVGLVVGSLSYLLYAVIFNAKEYGLAPAFFFGTCAACISPTAISSIIRQYKAKGHFVERVFQNLLVANVVAILSFSIVLGLTSSGVLGGDVKVNPNLIPIYESFKPLISNLIFIGVGILFAVILARLNNYKRTNDSRIIITISFIAILVAACSIHYSKLSAPVNTYIPFSKISPLLPCMAFGIFYFNLSKSEALFMQVENFLPPILCLFFVISGAKLDLSQFADYRVAVISLFFIVVRSAAQFASLQTYPRLFNCHRNTRVFMPMTMLTMTSVAVGLVSLAADVIQDSKMIYFVYTIILTSCVIFEIVGPLLSKYALVKTGSADPAVLNQLTRNEDEPIINKNISDNTGN